MAGRSPRSSRRSPGTPSERRGLERPLDGLEEGLGDRLVARLRRMNPVGPHQGIRLSAPGREHVHEYRAPGGRGTSNAIVLWRVTFMNASLASGPERRQRQPETRIQFDERITYHLTD